MYEIQVHEPAEVIAGQAYPSEWTTIDRKATRTLAAAVVLRLCSTTGDFRVLSPQGVVTLESATVREVIARREAMVG